MAFNPQYLENISSTMGSDNPGKGSGKRRKRAFKVNWKKRGYSPLLFDGSRPGFLSDYVKQLPEHAPATTARNNDGMSFVW